VFGALVLATVWMLILLWITLHRPMIVRDTRITFALACQDAGQSNAMKFKFNSLVLDHTYQMWMKQFHSAALYGVMTTLFSFCSSSS
jgi:hypothetical protein